jgi:hypothetical protein
MFVLRYRYLNIFSQKLVKIEFIKKVCLSIGLIRKYGKANSSLCLACNFDGILALTKDNYLVSMYQYSAAKQIHNFSFHFT